MLSSGLLLTWLSVGPGWPSTLGRLGAWAAKSALVEEYNRYSGSKGLCAIDVASLWASFSDSVNVN